MEAYPAGIPRTYKWHEVWQKVYFHPSVQSFIDILQDPTARPGRAFLWVAIMGAIVGLVQSLVTMLVNPVMPQLGDSGPALPVMTLGFTLVCGVIVAPIVAVIGLAIGAGVTRLVAGLFGGTGTFDRLVYAFGAISAPSTIPAALFSIITVVIQGLTMRATNSSAGLLGLCVLPFSLALGIYVVVLYVNAIRAVENLTTGKAVLVYFIPTIVFAIIFGVCLLLGLIPVIMTVINQNN